MKLTVIDDLHYMVVPGFILYAQNPDLLWPSYMALVQHYPELVKDRRQETVYVKCVE